MAEVHKSPGLTLVALPYVSKDGFAGPCVESLLKCFASGAMGRVSFFFAKDQTQVRARNDACEKALEAGAEWLWFIDSDQDFPVNALERLKAVGADVACADMWSRAWPSFRIVMVKGPTDENGKERYVPVADEVASRQGIEDVSFSGMGCTLIRTSIILKIRDAYPDQPWFWTAHHGEDATFCFKVLDIGGTVKCDFGLKSGHWGSCRMMGQDYTRGAVE